MKHFNLFTKTLLITLCIAISASCNNKPNNSELVAVNSTKPIKELAETPKKQSKKTILFFGDSLTAGYGIDESDSYPSLVQNRLDSLGLDYVAVNGGLSGETTAGGKGRIDWVLQQPVDIFVLELGANDMLRGLDINNTRQNLKDILEAVQAKYPSAQLIVAGMLAPPNMGKEYADEFQHIFASIAREYKAGLIPFLLSGLETRPDLILADGKHPNAEGQKIVLENVWAVLKDYL